MNGLMLNMFSAMFSKLYNSIRGLAPVTKGLIMFVLVFGAFMCFIFAVKGSKKDKLIKNWFLFFVFIALVVFAVAFAFMI
ncbi:MAG: hypothetical protein IJE91_00180 [Clostridia bacterium]|nr:hypothetical protein [Clostridia bacterium]